MRTRVRCVRNAKFHAPDGFSLSLHMPGMPVEMGPQVLLRTLLWRKYRSDNAMRPRDDVSTLALLHVTHPGFCWVLFAVVCRRLQIGLRRRRREQCANIYTLNV